MTQPSSLEALVAALEAQRPVLGDAAVEFAITALRDKAAQPAVAEAAEPKLRQVSVLFCDIADSTAMLQHLDAETALQVVGTSLQRFAALIRQRGGKVLRFTGDGIKAAFGSEQAREDDAEQAVHAGLALLADARQHADTLQRESGVTGFALRVGIHTGPVLLGGGAEADHSAIGHAVHIAARLEQAAPVGQLRISHHTWQQVRGLFDAEAQPLLVVKGSDEALLTYLVYAARPHATARRGLEDVHPALVGRSAEMQQLLATVARAAQTAQLQTTTVLADAGLGKTRLMQELLERLPPGTRQLFARGHPASMHQPYGLLRDLLLRWCAIADDDSAEVARRKLGDRLAPLVGEAEIHRAGQLVGLDFSGSPHLRGVEGRELRDRGSRALTRLLQAHAAAGTAPLLVLLDDVHWADQASLDFVQHFAGTATGAIALLAFARPSLLERRPEGLGTAMRITLQPLPAAHAQALAAALLQRLPEPPPDLPALLVQRAEGNPFFMEELVRMLVDDGVIAIGDDGRWSLQPGRLATLRVPETLVGVLQARLDALPASERGALQQASIIGPVFWDGALAAIDDDAPAALPALQRRRLVRPRSGSAFDQYDEFTFHHQLLHDVTYGTVLQKARRDGHARAARWLMAHVGERADEFMAVAGEHFERAGDSAQALDCFDRAGLQASLRFAHASALAYIHRALAQAALESQPERHFALLCRRQQVADRLSDEALQDTALEAAMAFAEAQDSDAMRARVFAMQSLRADRNGRQPESAALARRAVELGEPSGSAIACTLGHAQLAWLAAGDARFDEVERHLAAARPWALKVAELPPAVGGFRGYPLQLQFVAVEALLQQERFADAARALDEAAGMLSTGTGIDGFSLRFRQSVVALRLGQLNEAERLIRDTLLIARDLDVTRHVATVLLLLTEVAELRDDHEAQLDLARQVEAVARPAALGREIAQALGLQAGALMGVNQLAAVQPMLEEALALNEQGQRTADIFFVRARLARLALMTGQRQDALAQVEAIFAHPDAEAFGTVPEHLLWRVLVDLGDARAALVRQRLHQRLQTLLAQLPRAEDRQRLQAVSRWRDVLRASAA